MRKTMWVATLLSLLVLLVAGPDAEAGPIGSLNVQDGHVLIAEVGPGVDAVPASQTLNGVWSWFFVIDDLSVPVTNPTVTVDSGYPVSAFPGGLAGATSFPVSVSGPVAVLAGTLNFVMIEKLSVNTESGTLEKLKLSIFGFGNATSPAPSTLGFQVSFSGIRYSSEGVLLFT